MLQSEKQVAARLGICRHSVRRYMHSDPTFPAPIRLSAGCVRWHSEEVEAWLEARPRVDAA